MENDYTEREKAIIETALLHFSTDSAANGVFDQAGEARRLAEKVRDDRRVDGLLDVE